MNKVLLTQTDRDLYRTGSLWQHVESKEIYILVYTLNGYYQTSSITNGHYWSVSEDAKCATDKLARLGAGSVVTITVE